MRDGIRFNFPGDGDAIAAGYEGVFNPLADVSIGRVRDGTLLGGVAFTGYTGRSIEIMMAGFSKDWVNKDILWVAFHYPFVQLGCEKLFGRVKASNRAAIDADMRLGFQLETVVKDVFPDGDLLVLSMYRKDCRWLTLRPAQLRSNQEG